MGKTIDQALQEGVAAHKAGELKEAERLYKIILNARPNHPDANHNLGILSVSRGKVEEALPFLKCALETNRQQVQFWISYISALIKADRLDSARQTLQQGRNLGVKGDQIDLLEKQLSFESEPKLSSVDNAVNPSRRQLEELVTLHRRGKLKEALVQGSALASRFPDNPIIPNILGAIYAGLGKQEEAFISYKRAIELQPKHFKAHNNLGIILKNNREYQEALDIYKKAIALKPDYAEAHCNRGTVLSEMGKYEEAIASYNKAIEFLPTYFLAHNNLGNALNEMGKVGEAIASYNRAIKLKPDYAEAYYNLGVALNVDCQFDEAAISYMRAAILRPEHAKTYSELGIVLNGVGNLISAESNYRRALALKRDFEEPYYNLGKLLFEIGEITKAIEVFTNSNYKDAKTYLLRCFFNQNNPIKFFEHLDTIIEEDIINPLVGSLISRSEIRYGVKKKNLFAENPLKFVVETDISKDCDFQGLFVRGVKDVLNENTLPYRDQTLLLKGKQTAGNIFSRDSGPILNIKDIILTEIDKYRARFGEEDEGFLKRWPKQFNLNGWLIRMKSGGQIAPHMHSNGWVSGAVYINVPAKETPNSGNFVVCLDDQQFHETGRGVEENIINISTGSLVIFPSSLLHYTIPFNSVEDRIVLAFDAMPV